MRPLDLPAKADGARIAAVANYYVTLKPWVESIRVAYGQYQVRRSIALDPIGIDAAASKVMERAYTSKGKKAKLSWIRDLQAAHSLHHCPLCGGLGGRTVEHHLPQSHYPEFSIYSSNLLPSCRDCNGKRGAFANRPGVALATLHPYFDQEILGQPLVYVSVLKPWAAPKFKLLRLPMPDVEKRRRVDNHLRVSIDDVAFQTWMRGRWGDFRAKTVTDHATVASLVAALEKSLNADHLSRNHNSWDAALTRGVLRRPALLSWLLANQLAVPRIPRASLGL